MKLNIHQLVVLIWVIVSPIVYPLILQTENNPDRSTFIKWGIVSVTIMIALVPLILKKWPLFRQNFCWTDELSPKQRRFLAAGNWRQYYQITYRKDFARRTSPYAGRLAIVCFVLIFPVYATLPQDIRDSTYGAIVLFILWYPVGALLLLYASWPFPKREKLDSKQNELN